MSDLNLYRLCSAGMVALGIACISSNAVIGVLVTVLGIAGALDTMKHTGDIERDEVE